MDGGRTVSVGNNKTANNNDKSIHSRGLQELTAGTGALRQLACRSRLLEPVATMKP
jgi:hypothetical protein